MTRTSRSAADERAWMTRLRSAQARGSTTDLVAVLADEPWPGNCLQIVGDALIGALLVEREAPDEHGPTLQHHAEGLVASLADRGWDGDRELAVHLNELTGAAGMSDLQTLTVDLDEVSGVLEGDPTMIDGGRIEIATGEVVPRLFDAGYSDEDDDGVNEEERDAEEWIWIENVGSRDAYADMEAFVEWVSEPSHSELLGVAIQGRGAFGRFRATVDRWDGESTRWQVFSDDRTRGRAREWLAQQGHRAVPK